MHAGDRAGDEHELDDPAGADGAIEEHILAHRGRGRATTFPVGLRRLLRQGDVLVLHEGWTLSNHVAALEARRARIPYLVMPHGVYEHAWLGYLKALRPRKVAERAILRGARAVHLFFASEAVDLLALEPGARWFAVPTGMVVPNEQWTGGGGYLSWVGRIDPFHKGLDLLVEAVDSLPPEHRPRIALRGYDYRGGSAALRHLVTSRHLEDWFEIGGVVNGPDRIWFMLRSDGCVHPSRWDSHPLALVESLALGVPCLVSTGAHIAPELVPRNAAIVVRPRPAEIGAGLVRLAEEGPTVGPLGRRFVEERLSWDAIVSSYIDALAHLGLS
jgi:glycosyltransferase involved in cell wall biosynthesis